MPILATARARPTFSGGTFDTNGNKARLLVESAFTIASGTTLGLNSFNQTIGCSRMRAA
jgi:hypothetical protein